MNKKVKITLPAEVIDMDGISVKQAFPTQKVPQIDPFLLLHHARVVTVNDRPARIQGVGPHPHRGFSPVTFVIEGEVHHQDSRGNSQIAKQGEVKWIHSGAGIIHSERPTQELVDREGVQEIVQLWINSPAAKKMKEPEYVHVHSDAIPRVSSSSQDSDIKLISGSYAGKTGPFHGQSELLILWGKVKQGAEHSFTIPATFTSSIYIVKGCITVDGYGITDSESLLFFEVEGDQISMKAKEDSEFLLLAGAPIDEPVVQHGPFVMNTETEILEAMRDYQMGKMGFLVEE